MTTSSPEITPTDRIKFKRVAERGTYDRDVINAIFDEALICQVGFSVQGRPFVIPTIHWRIGDALYLHGSPGSRLLRHICSGEEVCISVTHLDGLILARSAFHHSMNYRSALVFGQGAPVEDETERMEALRVLTDKIAPGRWDEVRAPNEVEMKQTLVVRIPISEASAKTRTGGPKDDEVDYELDIWAGIIPLKLVAGEPIPDDRLNSSLELSQSARAVLARQSF